MDHDGADGQVSPMHKIDIFAITSLVAALTARQEEMEWWIRNGSGLIAATAGLLAIWRHFRKPPPAP